jgi:isocitrate/isopropylmalate dehydrogenase
MGRHIINPTATLLSAKLMLDHLGFADAGARLETAITTTYREGKALTPDQGGDAHTEDFCEAVKRHLA